MQQHSLALRVFNPAAQLNEKEDDIQKGFTYMKQECTEEMKGFLIVIGKKIENGHQTLQTTKNVVQYGAEHNDQYQKVTQAAKRLIVSPVFSRQNLFKTGIRNKFDINNLTNLMMISIEGPDRKKVDFSTAFHK